MVSGLIQIMKCQWRMAAERNMGIKHVAGLKAPTFFDGRKTKQTKD